jgi:transcriptional regulator with XRE-family HTH domain
MAGKRPDQTDVAVGQRIRAFRRDADLSQTELANRIGVTFQQVQKYEKGVNRVGAGRLTQIADALDVPITAFFEGLARPADKRRRSTSARIAELSAIPAASKLLAAFTNVSDSVIETELVNLIRSLGGSGRRRH